MPDKTIEAEQKDPMKNCPSQIPIVSAQRFGLGVWERQAYADSRANLTCTKMSIMIITMPHSSSLYLLFCVYMDVCESAPRCTHTGQRTTFRKESVLSSYHVGSRHTGMTRLSGHCLSQGSSL